MRCAAWFGEDRSPTLRFIEAACRGGVRLLAVMELAAVVGAAADRYNRSVQCVFAMLVA